MKINRIQEEMIGPSDGTKIPAKVNPVSTELVDLKSQVLMHRIMDSGKFLLTSLTMLMVILMMIS